VLITTSGAVHSSVADELAGKGAVFPPKAIEEVELIPAPPN
jgi:hypothetical protein